MVRWNKVVTKASVVAMDQGVEHACIYIFLHKRSNFNFYHVEELRNVSLFKQIISVRKNRLICYKSKNFFLKDK